MINSLLNFISDTSLKLRAGKITYSLPARRLYRIAPYGGLSDDVIYATPLDTYTHGKLGVTVTKSYAIGENVIFLEGATADSATGLLYGIIIGAVPIGAIGIGEELTDKEYLSTVQHLDSVPKNIETCKYPELITQEELVRRFQVKEMMGAKGFAKPNTLTDLPGDYNISGYNSIIGVDDMSVVFGAGNSKIRLNGVYDMLDTVTPLYRTSTAGSFEQLYLLNDNFFHLALKGLSRTECYKKKKPATFRYSDALSNYLYGKRTSILAPDGMEVSSIQQSLDGSVVIGGVSGVSIEKTVMVRPSINPKDFPLRYSEEAELKSVEDISKVAKSKDLWKPQVEREDDKPSILPPPTQDDYSSIGKPSGQFDDGISKDKKIPYIKAKALIKTLPSGGILLRDAWGSEIRMEGGNIQISAANNMTTVAGRDVLNLCSGVFSTNAGEEVNIGASNKSVILQGNSDVVLATKSGAVRLIGKAASVETSMLCADLDEAAISAKTAVVTGNRLTATSNELTLHADSVSISGSRSALLLDTSAVLGSQHFVVKGPLSIQKGGMELTDIPTADGDTITVKTSGLSCMLTVEGPAMLSGTIATGGRITASGGVYAATVGAKSGALGALKSAPTKPRIQPGELFTRAISEHAQFISHIKETFDKIKEKAVFCIKSKAFKIWEPLFAKQHSAEVKLSIATAKDESYIYPGKDFWESNGLQQYSEESESSVNYKDPQICGVSKLRLNGANIEEVKQK